VLHAHWKSSCRRINRPASEEFRNNFYSGPFHSVEQAAEVSPQSDDDHGHSRDRQAVSGQDLFLVRGVLQWMNHTTQIRTLATGATLRPNRNPFNTGNVIRM
jgi:hypothetical protein